MTTHGDQLKTIRSATSEADRPSSLKIWFTAARPRTLPVGLAPVLVGAALAAQRDQFHLLTFLAAILGALFIQVGANLSNDYSDARRGADTDDRLGPLRVTAGDLVPPKQVLAATWISFALAMGCGIYLIAQAGWEILAIGIASILAGLLYTGGPRPYGYSGLGEVFVFLFFGVAAVAGTYFALTEEVIPLAFILSIPVGLMAAAVLVVNNVRDIDTDRRVGKKTLAVRLGRPNTRRLYASFLIVSYLVVIGCSFFEASLSPWLLLTLLSAPMAVKLTKTVSSHVDGPTLNGALAKTGALELLFCLLLSAGILLS